MGKHITALYNPFLEGSFTYEYMRYSFPEFVHKNPGEFDPYTQGVWLDPHKLLTGPVPGPNGLFIRPLLSPPSPPNLAPSSILAVADAVLPNDLANISFVLSDQKQVYAQTYAITGAGSSGGGLPGQYSYVFDQNWGNVPPNFLEMAALVDADAQEVHAITLAVDSHGNSFIVDWFGSLPFGNDLGSWTVVPLILSTIPGGRLVAASYSPSLKEREILVATTDTIKLIRSTKHSTQLEDFASFSGETIISITSFSVPEDTAQRAIVATTSNDLVYQLWEISYEQSVAQPLLIGTISDFNLIEISGYANPTESLRHIAMISSNRQIYRGSYNPNGSGFQYGPWPGAPFAQP